MSAIGLLAIIMMQHHDHAGLAPNFSLHLGS